MRETPAEQPWSAPVHDIAADRADLPLYRRLYACTEQVAKPVLQQQLKAITDDALADEVMQGLHGLRELLLQDPDDTPQGAELAALQALDPVALEAWRQSLSAHLQAQHGARKSADDRADLHPLARQMAAELARSLWSTLLDHAAQAVQAGNGGAVPPEHLLPTWPDSGVCTPLQYKLQTDLKHFSLPLEALVAISHQTLSRLLGSDAAAARIQLPQRLHVERRALQAFLDAQAMKQQLAPQVVRTPKRRGDKPALTSAQPSAW